MFSGVSLNSLYALKSLDLFSTDVKLRIQRSREGGLSDQRVGSWFGVFISMTILAIVVSLISGKVTLMYEYENIVYSTNEMKNDFGKVVIPKRKSHTDHNKKHNEVKDELTADEIYLKDYTFLPSIEFTFTKFS